MRAWAVLIVALGLWPVTLLCAGAPAAVFRGDALGSGRYGDESAERIGDVRFSLQADGPIRSTPAIHGGRLYVGTARGTLYAADAKTGRILWTRATGGAITSSPATDGRSVYFSSRDGRVRSVGAADGTPRWTLRFGHDIGTGNYWDYYMSSPILVGATLFVGGGDGILYAVEAASGHVRWKFDAGARIRSTPAVHDGRIVFGTTAGHALALRTSDGALLWKFATQGASHSFADQGNDTTSVMASPTIADGTVAIGGRDGFLYGLDLASGQERWRVTHDGSSWMLATAYDGRWLFVGGGSAQLVTAVDPRTGAEQWRFATRGAVFASLTVAGRTLLCADFAGNVYALDRSSGALAWQFPLRARVLATPVAAKGLVYVAGDGGVLLALAIRHAGDAEMARGPGARRIAYWQGAAAPGAFSWFQNGVDAALLAYLESAGYERLDRAALASFMRAPPTSGTRSVVVFTDNRIPEELVDTDGAIAPLRRYLDAGGKVVLVGSNPLAYRLDAGGQVSAIDFSVPSKLFDVRYAEPEDVNGYYASFPTRAGRALGLRSPFIASGAVDPDQSITVLAEDEFGKASAWLKSYGGAPGTGLLQLALPRQDVADYSEWRAVIEAGITR